MVHFTRIIHSIGQGGFCSETFRGNDGNEVNIIYDCGGKSEQFMSKYIPTWKPVNSKIDAVFISHLHSDHINGLKFLLDNYTIDKLILPALTLDEKVETILYNIAISENSNEIIQFTIKLLNKDSLNTEVQEISTTDDGEINFDPNEHNNGIIFEKHTSINQYIYYSCGSWLYIPWNPTRNKKNGLYDKIKDNLNSGKDFTITDLPQIIKNHLTECKNLYTEHFKGKHNSYSMTLFSGLMGNSLYSTLYCIRDCFKCNHYCRMYQKKCCFNPNYLHTGDYEPEEAEACLEIIKFYGNELWSITPSIQVPHHGSKHNFDKALYKDKLFGVISCGKSNRFDHPHKETILGMCNCGCIPVIVTEDICSTRVRNYYFHKKQHV